MNDITENIYKLLTYTFKVHLVMTKDVLDPKREYCKEQREALELLKNNPDLNVNIYERQRKYDKKITQDGLCDVFISMKY